MSTTTRAGKPSLFPWDISSPASSSSRFGFPFRPSTSSDLLRYTSSPYNSVFFVVLLLASGSRSFFSAFYVYYGRRRHRQFCSPSHVPCISTLSFTSIPHTKHRSTHSSSISTHTPTAFTYIFFQLCASPIISNAPTWERMVYSTG